ncbi:MAG: hypothetical protein IJU44_02665, partial [Kiritimatiellae bacterium]|nr:hypothetical protein [Kiritimatiellia bacterium]
MDYALTSDSLITFGRKSVRQNIAFTTWAALIDAVGPQLIPFVVKTERFADVPFQELGLAPVKISELIPQPGEMWILFCFRDAFREKLGAESALRTDGFPLVLEWRKGEPDSLLLAPTFHILADLVRRQLGVKEWGLWPAFRRYGDKVAFIDDSLFGTVHDSMSSIASAYGALLAGLSCAISGRHPPVWPFPTLQWDIVLGRTSGVAGLAEKLSVAADCSATVVTVAGEQRRQAKKVLLELQASADGARYRDITIESVRNSSSPEKLAERICEIATRRKRVLRLVVSLMLCLVALTVLSVLCWLDSNRTVIVPYADYVDSYGLPEGI